jgi:hypothetical protein
VSHQLRALQANCATTSTKWLLGDHTDLDAMQRSTYYRMFFSCPKIHVHGKAIFASLILTALFLAFLWRLGGFLSNRMLIPEFHVGNKSPESQMTFRLAGAIAILAIVALPALAQTPTSPSSQNSGVGIAGQPGGKNGPAPNTTATNGQQNPTTQLQDTSKIQGKPGGKSGPAVKPPSKP